MNRESAGFDYTCLIVSKRAVIREQACVIRGLLGRTAGDVIQVGLRLQMVRKDIGRAHFQDWLRAEFDWSQSAASNYMRAAAVFGQLDCPDQFQPSALYILSRRRVPLEVRREAVRRARSGEFITKAEARRLVTMHASSKRPDGGRTRRSAGPAIKQARRYLRNLSKKIPLDEQLQLAEDLARFAEQLKRSAATQEMKAR